MPNEREDFYQPLKFEDYDIAGNKFRAYYDMDDKLVFVVDFVISKTKPNVLLVINPVGDRKWDDILMNDYGVDLETVRPKKDNKYQKLDIEYTGLSEYDALIQAYEDDDDVTDALDELESFRQLASMRAALERMAAAELTASRARETIEKTKETVQELQARLKLLRNKLTAQRRNIGKEPTKQSAAKILRTESQIDSVNEKLQRAKKRQQNAQHRLSQAIDESDVAREIMDVLEEQDVANNTENLPAAPVETSVAPVNTGHDDVLVVRPAPTNIVTHEDAPVPMRQEQQSGDVVPYEEDDFEDDDWDEEYEDNLDDESSDVDGVKPLFNEDPKILDENIAFQPIDFGAADVTGAAVAPMISTPSESTVKVEAPVIQPLVFTPPVSQATTVPEEPVIEENASVIQEFEPVTAPVLESLTPVRPSEEDKIDAELIATAEPVVAPVETNVARPESPIQEPVVQENITPNESVMPEIEVASDNSGHRPLSPVADASVVTMAHNGDAQQRKPTMLYYGLLLVLIVLSVFTLWVYQRSLNESVPELGAKIQVVAEVAQPDAQKDMALDAEEAVVEETTVEENPFLDTVGVDDTEEDTVDDENVSMEQEETDVQVMPMPMDIVQMAAAESSAETPVEEDVAEEDSVAAADVVVEQEVVPAPSEEVFLSDEVEEQVTVESDQDILAKKPEYGVNREEAVFVADPEYETEAPAVGTAVEPMTYQVETDIVSQSESYEDAPVCEDGTAPDVDGCCGDEVLMDIDGRAACCSESSGDCFDPLI